MVKIISSIAIVFIVILSLILSFYEVRFDSVECDILLHSRSATASSYGINFRNGLKVWRFTNGKNGMSAKEIYSFDNGFKPEPESRAFPFKEGEKLIYNVYSAGIMVGKSSLIFHGEEELRGEKVLRVTFSTNLPLFSDYENIYADNETFLPVKIERKIKRIGGFSETITERYNQSDFTVNIDKKSSFSSDNNTIKKNSPIYNAILLTYYCRAHPDIADKGNIKITLPTQDFYIRLSGQENIKVPAGEYPVDVFSSTPSKFTFYLSKDKDKLPVKIDSSTVLNYSMELHSIESSG